MREKVRNGAFGKLHDVAKAERLTKEVLEEWGVEFQQWVERLVVK